MIGKRVWERSFSQFRTNPLRTFLTLLGMVFGVGSVVAMVSIGEGAQREILSTIESMGADVVHIQRESKPNEKLRDIINDSLGLRRQDSEALKSLVPGVKKIAYREEFELNVTDLSVPTNEITVFGVSPHLIDVHHLSVSKGRHFTIPDHFGARRVCILGDALAKKSFGTTDIIGRQIRIEYSFFEVVGVFSERLANNKEEKLPVDPEVYDMAVVVPFNTLLSELSPAKTYNELEMISIQVEDTKATLQAKLLVIPALKKLHGGHLDFEVIAPEELLQKKKSAQSVLNLVLISIAAISLLVGGIGVMNIMLANIMERISEIGLRRAVGAKRNDIRNQFLVEAVVICLVGGLAGIVLGLMISFTVGTFFDLPVGFAWHSMVLSFVISVGVGVVFGLVPAIKAAEINPIEALQRE
jgi:putative ABC transport system permease protein